MQTKKCRLHQIPAGIFCPSAATGFIPVFYHKSLLSTQSGNTIFVIHESLPLYLTEESIQRPQYKKLQGHAANFPPVFRFVSTSCSVDSTSPNKSNNSARHDIMAISKKLEVGGFAIIKSQTGLNSYKLSVKEWIEKTGAIGLKAAAGGYGGTYAHPDIAFEFGIWISPQFKIYLIREF